MATEECVNNEKGMFNFIATAGYSTFDGKICKHLLIHYSPTYFPLVFALQRH